MKIEDLNPNDVIHIQSIKQAKKLAKLLDKKHIGHLIPSLYPEKYSFRIIYNYCYVYYGNLEEMNIVYAKDLIKDNKKKSLKKRVEALEAKLIEVKEPEVLSNIDWNKGGQIFVSTDSTLYVMNIQNRPIPNPNCFQGIDLKSGRMCFYDKSTFKLMTKSITLNNSK